jgi:acyl-CoA synthetase (AMP-forming)/AMP-acid ligase II
VSFEITPPLFHDFIRLNGKWYPDKPAIIDEGGTLSWGELDRHSSKVANGLISLGIGKGDGVAILMTNCVEYVEVHVRHPEGRGDHCAAEPRRE